ncbi:MAG: double-strand break repair helicase AddA [Rhodospirillales bacterium]|nr:double-strand break repair helicase AddA [Rhodospirillales bacterium]MCB9997107.1 double-strand break repair helicase AddA [Rhodospirillales bacterium]
MSQPAPTPEKSAAQSDEQSTRPLDPNVLQRRAADPGASVWVGASAGTGKTKVLTDRVLRLLLPRPDGRPGTAPHRILCLTFTKAAASEMLQRINKILGKWAVIPEQGLFEALQNLTGKAPGPDDITAARKLFASVIDTPGGLKVMTIHSFCQSVLSRFPLEAGLPPHFKIIDDAPAGELLAGARDAVLNTARQDPDSPLGRALKRIAAAQNEDQFGHLLRSLCSERLQLEQVPENPHPALCTLFGLPDNADEQSLLRQACADASFDKQALYRACRALSCGAKGDQQRGHALQCWLDATPDRRADDFEPYKTIYLTAAGEIRKKLASKGALDADPETDAILSAEAARLLAVDDSCKALRCARFTADLLSIGRAIFAIYQQQKEAQGVLDYDDLILKTRALLGQADMAPWVLYKLDGGLDHLLIDEAQDTNPEQWQIIQTLCTDFFSGQGVHDDITRTVFTVGDEKQSIYSFQRASPAEFARMQDYFADKARAGEEKMEISFRSVQSVLALVDAVFAPEPVRAGLGRAAVSHQSFRIGQAGLAELWPLFGPGAAAEEQPWTPPTTVREIPSGAARLAEYIGTRIKRWLDDGEIIDSLGRPVRPGDIMILVRTRTAFVGQLVRALKTRNIPVSGVDRMVLGEQLAVMDMLAAAQFALLPDDDLTLASLLKSPLIGMDEDRLFALCHGRKGTLWEVIRAEEPEIAVWLQDLIKAAASDHPYEFFSRILQRSCPAGPVSGQRAILSRLGQDAIDPLDEFLNAALSFEHDHVPTLQGFLLWQQQGDITIKRELEEAGQAVRIMTVHGSKGLQAPIVIMPDTTRTAASKRTDTLLWPDKTGLDLPLWAARSDDYPALYSDARARLDRTMDEEYRRLLYVALTRAEDRIYIGGHTGKREPIEDCWYNYIAAAFNTIPDVEDIDLDDMRVKRFSNPQTRPPKDPAESGRQQDIERLPPPDWLFTPAPSEPTPPYPLTPSRPDDPEPAIRSPLQRDDQQRFKRGILTHKLLQLLPSLPPEHRRDAAQAFLAQPGHGLSAPLQAGIAAETMAILEHPDYAALFGPDSAAEIPVTGYVNGRLISAQIDRLLVTDHEIIIVDFKTNRPPPREESGVPDIYRDQLKAYSDIVAGIWPARAVRCFLLWTDGPMLMELTSLYKPVDEQ